MYMKTDLHWNKHSCTATAEAEQDKLKGKTFQQNKLLVELITALTCCICYPSLMISLPKKKKKTETLPTIHKKKALTVDGVA